MTPIRPRPRRRCVHCGILSRRLDRADWCPLCQRELADGRVYINWEAPARWGALARAMVEA